MNNDKLATEKDNEDKNKDYQSLDKSLKYEYSTNQNLKNTGARRELKIHDGTTTNKAFNVGYEELKKKNKVVHRHADY